MGGGDYIDHNAYVWCKGKHFLLLFKVFFSNWTSGRLAVGEITTTWDSNKATKLQTYLNADVFQFSVSSDEQHNQETRT